MKTNILMSCHCIAFFKRSLFCLMFSLGVFASNAQFSCDSKFLEESSSDDESFKMICMPEGEDLIPYLDNAVPLKEIRVMTHIIQMDDGSANYQSSEEILLDSYFDRLNELLANMQITTPQTTSCPADLIVDSKLRFVNSEYHFYQDDDHWCTDTGCFSQAFEVYNTVVTDNVNLTTYEKENYLHLIIVGVRGERVNEGADCDDNGCANPSFSKAGLGPDDFVILRGIYDDSWDVDGIAKLYAHEFGHSVGDLRHSWTTNCCDVDNTRDGTNNFMDYSVLSPYNDLRSFSPCQLGKFHENIITEYPHLLANDLCQLQSPDIVIAPGSSVSWDADRSVSQNVIVWGELNLSCTYEMAKDVYFEVKPGGSLNINGATMTTCDPTHKWKGIYVEGSTGAGNDAIVSIDGGVVENAEVVVRTFPYPWINSNPYYGGKFYLDNSTFTDCNRVFAQTSHQAHTTDSYLKNSSVNGGQKGCTIFNAFGIEISGNTFNDISQMCVKAEDSQVSIIENTFDSEDIGLFLSHEYNGISSEVIDNVIDAEQIGILSQGSPFASHYISGNDITSDMGIIMDRENSYEIVSNNFNGNYVGVFANSNNGLASQTSLNAFNGNFTGIFTQGNNGGFVFTENCFNESGEEDVYIDGLIFSEQGSSDLEAGNCFTKLGTPDINVVSGGGFNYFVDPNSSATDCNVPQSPLANFSIVDGLLNSAYVACGSQLGSDEFDHHFCHPLNEASAGEIIDYISEQIAYLEELLLGGSTENTEWVESLISLYERCLEKAELEEVEDAIQHGDFDVALSILNNESGDFISKARVLSIYMMQGELESAEEFLNELEEEATTEEEINFISMKRIGLKVKLDIETEVSEEDILTLKELSDSSYGNAAYARALYYRLTGELIYDLPKRELKYEAFRANVNIDKIDELEVYPNPASDLLFIKNLTEKSMKVSIFDLHGKLLYQIKDLQGRENLSTKNWDNGLYLVKSFDGKVLVNTTKLIIAN